MRLGRYLITAVLALLSSQAWAQNTATVITSCGTLPAIYSVGKAAPLFVDANGNLCTGTGGGTTSSNITQFGGTNLSTGTGASGAGIPRVTVSNDSTVGLASGSTIQPTPASTGGMSVFSKQVANNTTSFAVDASAGTLYAISAFNNSATIAYVKLYNTAQGSVTCGTPTPVDRMLIPANTAGAGFVWNVPLGVAYGTAITACVTTGFADNDTTAPAASTYIVNFYYK